MTINWNDKDFEEYAFEVIGSTYKGLPLTHPQKMRFLALTRNNPSLMNPPERKQKMSAQSPSTTSVTIRATAEENENALLESYKAEIASLDSKAAKYESLLKSIRDSKKKLEKKHKALTNLLTEKI